TARMKSARLFVDANWVFVARIGCTTCTPFACSVLVILNGICSCANFKVCDDPPVHRNVENRRKSLGQTNLYGRFMLRMSPWFPPRSGEAFFHSCWTSI